MKNESNDVLAPAAVITSEELLQHWLGHRIVTRRCIEAFPEDKLFTYSLGGMRTFAQLVTEILTMSAPGVKGVVTETWRSYQDVENDYKGISTRQGLLDAWDASTAEIKALWPQIKPERFHDQERFFGQWAGPVYWCLFYVIDNEIHHRAQGYVYLRSLGIEPPPFWKRD